MNKKEEMNITYNTNEPFGAGENDNTLVEFINTNEENINKWMKKNPDYILWFKNNDCSYAALYKKKQEN